MKPHWIVVALFGLSTLLISFAVSADDGVLDDDPNGFKGSSWDTHIAQFDGLVLWGESDDASGSKTYYLPHESLILGDVNVENILYSFYGAKFTRVTIKYRDGENYDALRSAMTARFGTGRDESRFSHDVSWVGMHTHIILRYDDQFNIGVLVVSQLEHQLR